MPLDADKARAFVEDLLKGNKALTEREVKAALGKSFRINPREIGASMIRDVRKGLGIDRPGALAFARSMLSKEPAVEAKRVMDAVSERFGVRLGPPDVSRLRPKRRASKGGARRGRPQGKRAIPKAAPAGSGERTAKSARAAGRSSSRMSANKGKKGSISLSFQGSGDPADLAAFFMELGRKG